MFNQIMAAMPKPPLVHNGRISRAQTNTEVFVLTGATYGIGTLRASVTCMGQTTFTRHAATAYSN